METNTNLWIKKPIKYNAFDYLIYFMIATSSFLVFQVRGQELLMLLQTLFCLVMLAYYKRVFFIKNMIVNAVFVSVFLAMLSALLHNVRASYTKTAVYMMIVLVPVYFATGYFNHYLKDQPEKWEIIRNALKLMCLVQMIWCLMQFVLYKGAGIDLNQIVFVERLHLQEYASFYKGGEIFMPTGLCWHPIIMAPVLILAYYLFHHIAIKAFVLLEALFIGNSTVLIAVMLCVVLDVIHAIYKGLKAGKIRKIVVIGIVSIVILAIVALLFTNLAARIWEKFSYVLQRITGDSNDLSTMAHIRYYTSYWKVFDNSSVIQILFGYGESCSGYTMSYLYSQYTSLGNWAVETDIMNIIYSRGIIGFLVFIGFLVQIIVKGRRIDYRYVTIIFCLFIAGVTYNVQFSWVLFLELLMTMSLEQRINLFGNKEKEHRIVW